MLIDPARVHADRYVITSLVVWLAATADAAGGLVGFWSVNGGERLWVLGAESLMLMALFANSLALKNWVYRNTTIPLYRQLAWLSVGSLALCICGDLVNFNLPQTFYRHGTVIRHDYLADSVWFFAPGYLLLAIAVIKVAMANGMRAGAMLALAIVAGLIGGGAFSVMHLPGAGHYVSAITGFYAVFITMVGASGLAFIVSFGKARFKPAVLLVGGGIMLAALADSVIGQFWIYGNDGEGYFPAARYINWVLYIGSQCLVVHLARVSLWHRGRQPATS